MGQSEETAGKASKMGLSAFENVASNCRGRIAHFKPEGLP